MQSFDDTVRVRTITAVRYAIKHLVIRYGGSQLVAVLHPLPELLHECSYCRHLLDDNIDGRPLQYSEELSLLSPPFPRPHIATWEWVAPMKEAIIINYVCPCVSATHHEDVGRNGVHLHKNLSSALHGESPTPSPLYPPEKSPLLPLHGIPSEESGFCRNDESVHEGYLGRTISIHGNHCDWPKEYHKGPHIFQKSWSHP